MTEYWILAAVEVLLQKAVGLGLFCKIYGRSAGVRGWKKWGLLIGLGAILILEIKNGIGNMISTSAAMYIVLMETIWLWMWTGEKIFNVLCWSFFYIWFFIIIKLPLILLYGLFCGGTLSTVNYGKFNEERICIIVLIAIFCTFVYNEKENIKQIVKRILDQWKISMLLIGATESILTIYIMNLVWEQFSFHVLILSLIVLAGLFSTMVLLFLFGEFRAMKKESEVIYSKDKMLEENYNLLKQEIERNSKINHDYKYDIQYLYDCILERDWEAGRVYIEPKLEGYRKKQGSVVWTGYKCIDFLIGSAKVRAEEQKVAFTTDIAMVEIPVAEYDFFTVLGNLLDNAVEAAEKCEGEGRYVMLRLCTINGMFTLSLENGYEEEPGKKKGKFLSSKKDAAGHGWGLENAREIVEKYEGMFQISYGKQVFRIDITLS